MKTKQIKVKPESPRITIGMVMEYARQQTDKVTEYYETIKILNKNLHETYGLIRMRDENIEKMRRELQSKGDSLDYYMKLAQSRHIEMIDGMVHHATREMEDDKKIDSLRGWRFFWRALAVLAVALVAAMYIIG